MARPKKINVADLVNNTTEKEAEIVELEESNEPVKAIKTPQKFAPETSENKVQLVNKLTGKIVAMAVKEALANKLVKSNPNIKIVQ